MSILHLLKAWKTHDWFWIYEVIVWVLEVYPCAKETLNKLMSGILQLCIMWFWIKWNSLCKKLYLSQLVVMKYNYEQLVLDICAHIYIVEDLRRVPIFFNRERVVDGNTSNFQTLWFNHLLQLSAFNVSFKAKLAQKRLDIHFLLCCSCVVGSIRIVHYVYWCQAKYSYDHFKNFLDLVECINLYYALCGGLSYKHKRNMLLFNSFNTCTCLPNCQTY